MGEEIKFGRKGALQKRWYLGGGGMSHGNPKSITDERADSLETGVGGGRDLPLLPSLAAAEAVRESSRMETMLLELRSVHDTLPGLGSLNRTSCSACAWMGVGTVRQPSSGWCVWTAS